MIDFIEFTGDETEVEFLKKCIEQWKLTISSNHNDMTKLMHIGTIFHEIQHRIEDAKFWEG